jgi:hypothetical protein
MCYSAIPLTLAFRRELARVTTMKEKPIPTFWLLGLMAFSLLGFRDAHRALKSGVVSGGRVAFGGSVKHYDRVTQPGKFWFLVLLTLTGASAFLITGLVLLLAT